MNLDWGQIVTQMIGFLIAVWLLKKYAWDKLLGIMEERRHKIASSFQQIEDTRNEVDALKAKYDKELEKIDDLCRANIQEAAKQANEMAAEIREEARRETVIMREKAKVDIAREIDKANAVLRDEIVDTVITATEKVIRERLDPEKHGQLIQAFINEAKVK
jgi:F-type H+-transporting ATPase subunit b